jgi:hypothetical protein
MRAFCPLNRFQNITGQEKHRQTKFAKREISKVKVAGRIMYFGAYLIIV